MRELRLTEGQVTCPVHAQSVVVELVFEHVGL